MSNHKIKIAVSSCLLGESVRYDGTDKHIQFITENLAKEYILISLCPEMAVGMGVPRPPIHLVDLDGSIQVLGIDNPGNNMTQPLSDYGLKVAQDFPDICGYILKKNSPSCGTENVKVLNSQGVYEKRGQGVYASMIINNLPMLPVINEEACLNTKALDKFLLDVHTYSEKLR